MGEERNLNLKKAYIQFTYTFKKKKKTLTNEFLKGNNPIKEWAKKCDHSTKAKMNRRKAHEKGPRLPCMCYVVSVLPDSLWPHGRQPARLLCSLDSPGKNTGGGCRALLQGISPNQQSNLHLLRLLYWRA